MAERNRCRAPNEACGVGHRFPGHPFAHRTVVTIINLIVIAPDHIRGITHGVVCVAGGESERADRECTDEFGTCVRRKEMDYAKYRERERGTRRDIELGRWIEE